MQFIKIFHPNSVCQEIDTQSQFVINNAKVWSLSKYCMQRQFVNIIVLKYAISQNIIPAEISWK